MNELLNKISDFGIIPVLKIDELEHALPLAKALIDGGLPVCEITFRTSCAKDSIKLISDTYKNMFVGAGTVLTIKQVDEAISAGAQFIVSPGLNPVVVKYCVDNDILIIPGCANASDIEAAIELGLNTVKFFPAEAAGGIKMIKALSGPYNTMKFMPTGGVTPANMHDYLGFDKIVACGGTWMIDAEAIKNNDFGKIEQLTKDAMYKMLDLKVAHVAINSNEKQSKELALSLDKILNKGIKETSKGFFASEQIEIINNDETCVGHIAISCTSVRRAIRFLSDQGIEFDYDTLLTDNKNVEKFIYIKQDFGGFKVHLMKG